MDFVWRLWILLLGQPASQSNGEITGNASLIKLHHWNTDAHAINGKIIACHACCGKRNFLPIFTDIWLARSSKLFYMEQMNYSTTCFCLCWKTAKVLSMASLSHFLSLSSFLHVLLFSFRNLFPSSLSQHPCILPHSVCASVCFLVFLFSINISHWTFCESCYLSCQSPLLILILTKKTDILELFESIKFMYRYLLISYFSPSFFHLFLLQQLMRERQQMASRPFASVAVTLDVGGTQIELLQGGIEVSLTFKLWTS